MTVSTSIWSRMNNTPIHCSALNAFHLVPVLIDFDRPLT